MPLLQQAALSRETDRLTLSLPDHADILVGDTVQRRFVILARALSCEAEIDYYDSESQDLSEMSA